MQTLWMDIDQYIGWMNDHRSIRVDMKIATTQQDLISNARFTLMQ